MPLWLAVAFALASAPQSSPKVVILTDPQTTPQLEAALASVGPQLEGEAVELEFMRVATASKRGPSLDTARGVATARDASGVFWFDESKPDEIGIFLMVDGKTLYGRRVPVDPATREAGLESVWLIVQASSLAVAAGEDVQMQPVKLKTRRPKRRKPPKPKPAPKPKPVETPEESEPEGVRFRLTLGYLGGSFATSQPWDSGGFVSFAIEPSARFRIGVRYGVVAPPIGSRPVWLRHEAAAFGGLRLQLADRLELEPRAAIGVEPLQWRGTEDDSQGVRFLATVGAELLAHVRLAGELYGMVSLAGSLATNRFTFIECPAGTSGCSGGERRVVLRPWWVRPQARAGLAYRF